MRVLIIEPYVDARDAEIEPTLAVLQELVGGYIETVPLAHGRPGIGIINEDGKIMRLPWNDHATAVVSIFPGDFISGAMVVVGPYTEDGEFTDLPLEVADWIKGAA